MRVDMRVEGVWGGGNEGLPRVAAVGSTAEERAGGVVDPGLRVRVWGRVGGWVCVCREQRRPLLSQGSVLRERVARSFLTI